MESSKIIHPPKKWRVVERSFWMFFFFQFVPRKKNVETACCMNILVDLVDWANIYIRNEEVEQQANSVDALWGSSITTCHDLGAKHQLSCEVI